MAASASETIPRKAVSISPLDKPYPEEWAEDLIKGEHITLRGA
jgi:hypothetical protein